MVGAGYWNEYDRHNGTTIYTKNPTLSQFNRKQRLNGSWGDQIEKNLAYFFNTVILRNPDTHGLNEANFEEGAPFSKRFLSRDLDRGEGHLSLLP